MGLLQRLSDLMGGKRTHRLEDWFQVSFDDDRVSLRAAPPGRRSRAEEFRWASVRTISFKAEGVGLSDGIYFFTSERPESYVVPLEAHGGTELWQEVLRRGLFDADLAIEAVSSSGGIFTWPTESPAQSSQGPRVEGRAAPIGR